MYIKFVDSFAFAVIWIYCVFWISKTVNSRINIPGTQINAAYDQYADSRSIDRLVIKNLMNMVFRAIFHITYRYYKKLENNLLFFRYLNNNYQESNYRFGSRGTEQYISCRKLFTDWENTRRLKENYNVDPRNRR